MAVYTEVSDDDLAAFVASYDLGGLRSYKGIAEGVENTNYVVHTEKGPFLLTLTKSAWSGRSAFFLGLLEHLSKAGINCPTRYAIRKVVCYARWPAAAALVTFLEGVWIRRPQPRHCLAVAKHWRVCTGRSRLPGNRANAWGCRAGARCISVFQSRADEIPRAGSDNRAGDRRAGSSLPGGLQQGIIHADLFPDNVFFLGDRLSALIDFYFACNEALSYDVAVTLNAWCFEADHAFNITKGRALLKGYQSVRPLTPAELDALPLLARGAALRFLLTRAYDWRTHPATPSSAPKTRSISAPAQVHRSIRAASEYGLVDGP